MYCQVKDYYKHYKFSCTTSRMVDHLNDKHEFYSKSENNSNKRPITDDQKKI